MLESDPTPFDIEREMINLNRRIDSAPQVIKEHHNKLREARAQFKHFYALAYASAEGSVEDRKQSAILACEKQQLELDVAEVEYRYVVDTMEALKTKLRALQSVSSLMKAQMFTPGGGV